MKCQYCTAVALYGTVDEGPTRCQEHTTKVMRKINYNTCSYPECYRRPTFNFVEDKESRYCRRHAKEGMVPKSRKCVSCNKIANYHLPGQPPRYCRAHAPIGANRRDLCALCGKGASFSYPGQRASHCKEHSLEGMVNTKHNKCLFCDKQARYDVPGVPKGFYCTTHAYQRIELIGSEE